VNGFWQYVLTALLGTVIGMGLAALLWYVVPRGKKPKVEEKVITAREINPDNPPKWLTYNPRPTAPARSCMCHPDRVLHPGQQVLWWPRTDVDGAVDVFCQDGVEEA
jgi:hypothetical protein